VGDFDLTGRVASVTGGNSGIGLGMADALARPGCAISIWGRNPEKNARASARLRARGGAVGERRHVTVMFCDLVDSTGIAAKLDAEEWRDLVGAYLEAASAWSRAKTGEGGCSLERSTLSSEIATAAKSSSNSSNFSMPPIRPAPRSS
jgi:NAD(P)-dependent dehydrogenase (short-subunit alcohol dehydrogenase family)